MNVGSDHLPALLAPGFEQGMLLAIGRAYVQQQDAKPRMNYVGDGHVRQPLYEVTGRVAVIEIRGTLLTSYPWVGEPWATGYDVLRLQFAHAFADPDVDAIVMDVESGGGQAAGCFELCEWIVAEKKKAEKPVVAICNDYAYSAACALTSCADTIFLPKLGGYGSIGVILVHFDYSKMLEEWGVKPTVMAAGKHKADGNFLEPLPDSVRDEWQAQIEDLRLIFCETVAANRTAAGINMTVDDCLATEARAYAGRLGTAEVLKLGLVDAILAPDAALAAVLDAVSKAAA